MIKKIKKHLNKDSSHLVMATGISVLALTMLWVSTFKIPDLKNFDERVVAQSTKIYDRTGEVLLYDVHQDIKRTVISFDEMPQYVKDATIAIEDSEFYQHKGIKPTSILRAVFANILSGGYSQGGSTITQQVVKNSVLTKEKKISRKLKEWVLAVKLEKMMSKDEILTLYLNESPYGGSIYGIQEASLAFYGHDAKELTLAESAYLAAIPKAPTFYSPYGENKEKLNERKNLVLKQMLENKFISEEQYNKAKDEKVTFIKPEDTGLRAAHFVMYIKQYLEEKYGTEMVENEGLKVITTLDYDLQQKGEDIVKRYALENSTKFNAENAALVAIDVKTGQILTMVGSRDYFDTEIDGNFNVALAHRQPGSAFKPFVYATAFNKGYTPDTVVYDLKTEFSTYCNADGTPQSPQYADRCYSPENYDGIYRGPMTLRNALAQSINVPAVKVLYLTGVKDALKTAKDMGIGTLGDKNQYGLTLVLGGGEVSPLDITSAYAVFANEGVRNDSTGILRVEDKDGDVLEEYKEKPVRVLPELSALYITSILSDNEAKIPAYGANSPLFFPGRDVASKTGTTNDYRDAWTVGYTTQVSVGVWAGNNDNSSMEKKVAGYIVTPMWNAFMQEVLAKYPDEKFKEVSRNYDPSLKPILRGVWQGGQTYYIDKISGKLATENTPEELKVEKAVENYHSILYWVDKDNPLGPKPSNPANDPQYERWEYGVRMWASRNGTSTNKPTEYDNVHTPELAPQIKIVSPSSTREYAADQKINILISNNSYSKYPLVKLNYYINDEFIGSSNTTVFSFVPNDIDNIRANNELKVVGYDSVMNKGETTMTLKLGL